MPSRQPRRLRVLTYNILLGGELREPRISALLHRSAADVIALQEVRDPGLVDRLAASLGMSAVIGPPSTPGSFSLAVLSRERIAAHHNHRHPSMLRSHLEVTLRPGRAEPLRVHVVHLAARFGDRAKGEARRLEEINEVLADIDRARPMPHLIVGDLNTLTPGEHLEATRFFRRMAELRRARLVVRRPDGLVGPRPDGDTMSLDAAWLAAGIDPHLYTAIPTLPRVVGPLTALLPRSRNLDRMMGRLIERWTIPRLLGQGYVDCYRRVHPRANGYTCATWTPAARIDYIFASPEMAARLQRCEVVGSRAAPDRDAAGASDHFPLVADFGLGRRPDPKRPRSHDRGPLERVRDGQAGGS